jgi:hypothetical protein
LTWVHERIFAAGGTHIPRTWASFADQTRITAVLHLNPERPERFGGDPPHSFLWLSIKEEDQLDEGTRWLAGTYIHEQVAAGANLLLHSSAGLHKTRWAFVSFLLCQGDSVAAAIRKAERPPWLAPYHTDESAWMAFAERIRRPEVDRRLDRSTPS